MKIFKKTLVTVLGIFFALFSLTTFATTVYCPPTISVETEPDVSISTHPALITQPVDTALAISSVEIKTIHVLLFSPTSVLRYADVL